MGFQFTSLPAGARSAESRQPMNTILTLVFMGGRDKPGHDVRERSADFNGT
jgi:hypothetical protein